MKILLVEDDRMLGESLKEYLENHGLQITWIDDESEVHDLLSTHLFDVIVLDLILRRRRGEDILRELRGLGIKTPVLILTAKRELSDKETCFESGADDYLTKPFEPKELLLRIRALGKRKIRDEVISIGEVRIDLHSKMVWSVTGREINLSQRSWDLLYLLVKNRGKLVTKEQIMSYVWGDSIVGDSIIRFYIKELRKILPGGVIKTMKGRGYLLN